jgi:mRNA interferase MazF
MEEGTIILASLPQSDGLIKNRPVLLLKKLQAYNDFIACGISSKLHQEIVGFDEIIKPTVQNRLKEVSLIRLGFLSVISKEQIKGTLGSISQSLHQELLERLASYLIE